MVKEIPKTDAGGMNFTLFFLVWAHFKRKYILGRSKGGLRQKTLYNFHF